MEKEEIPKRNRMNTKRSRRKRITSSSSRRRKEETTKWVSKARIHLFS